MLSEHWPSLLAAALWIGALASVVWRFRDSRSLDEFPAEPPAEAPLLTVVVPARDEAHNLEACVRSVLASTWPSLEVLVVDDHSTDGTGAIAARLAAEDARVRLIPAPDLPAGWFGKQWACHTGARAARGELLCFTDADTRHAPDLLARSVNGLRAVDAQLFTVAGRQLMETFWEKVVQPVVFAMFLSRYGGLEAMSRSTNPRNKIANGQFMLFARDGYDRLGGHASVRDHVAEDLRLAQRCTEEGLRMHMVLAPDHLATRMYTSLRELRRGWGKNVYAAGRDTFPDSPVLQRLLPFIYPLFAVPPMLPAVAFLLGWSGLLGEGAIWFAAVTAPGHLAFWMGVYAYSRISPLWAVLHPLGALVFGWIFAESAWRGSRVEWKGREYLSQVAGPPER
ncbi:MAG: glycosyltransferase [Gemmatimonadetes bacterium]|nr:glycosyltransferase [Gemmatimonadota bacterium]